MLFFVPWLIVSGIMSTGCAHMTVDEYISVYFDLILINIEIIIKYSASV